MMNQSDSFLDSSSGAVPPGVRGFRNALSHPLGRAYAFMAASLAISPVVLGRQAAVPDLTAAAVTLPGQIDLADLVELVGKRLGVSVQYQREALRKPVSLRLQDAVTNDELWRVLTSVLEGQGLVVVQSDQPGLYRIVTIQNAASENQHVKFPGQDVPGAGGDGGDRSSYLSIVIKLRSGSADEIAKAVQPLLTPTTGMAKAVGDGGLLLLSDVRHRVVQAQQLVELLDGPADMATTFVVEFKALTASEASKLLDTVWSAQAAADSRRAKPGGVTPAAGGGSTGAPKVIPLAGEQRAMVVCPASAAPAVKALLADLDQREPRETRTYAVAGVAVEELATSIRQLLDADRPSSPSPSGGPAADIAKVTPDKLTGSVLVTATARDHAKVAPLVDRLASLPPSARQSMRSIVIKNRDAAELSQTLRELLGAGGIAVDVASGKPDASPGTSVSGAGTAVTGNDAAVMPGDTSGISTSGIVAVAPPPPSLTPGGASTAQTASKGTVNPPIAGSSGGHGSGTRGISITVDKPTNTIIAVGDPALLSQLETLVASLDKRQPQVVLDVQLLTMNNTEALSFGVEMQKRFNEGDTTINLASLFGLAASGALQGGTGFTGTVVRIGDYQVLVRALENLNYGRAVSMPKMLVNNNVKSSIKSVQRQPFTSINASTTVATTSFGGTQDAGTTVTVKPQITEGDHLVLDYSVELSAFTGAPTTLQGGGVIPPPSQQNTVEGSVTLPDGYTVVIGGLRNTTSGKTTARIPVLGAIPILGALFGTTTDNDSDARFYVFIRATIVRAPAFEDLKNLQAGDLKAAGVDSGEPTLDPLWVE